MKWVAFHLTDRCNLNCAHCLRDPGKKPVDLPLELIDNVLDQSVRVYRNKHVALTGGEPTHHPDFPLVLDAIVHRGMTWHMVSNGDRFHRVLRWFDEVPKRGEALTAINFSVDGADEETHDRIRGQGSFREVLTAITLAKARNLRFTIQMTLHAWNVDQIETMGLMASQLGAAELSFGMTMATGTPLDAQLFLSARQWQAARDRMERLSDTLRIPVLRGEGLPTEHTFHVCEAMQSQTLHVDNHGRLNLCCMHSGIPGGSADVAADLRTTSLIQGHEQMLRIIHDAERARLRDLGGRESDDWDLFSCNSCLKAFGKPYWDDEGADGAEAKRERWRGAWAADVTRDPSRRRRIKLNVV